MHTNEAERKRVIVALDTPLERAKELITILAPYAAGFKVGFRHIASGGAPELIRISREHGVRLFYDGKFKDIPNTVAEAVGELNPQGIWMCNLHCDGGLAMMQAAKKKADERTANPMLVIGVTLLTSLSYDDLHQTGCIELRPDAGAGLSQAEKDDVLRRHVDILAQLAEHAGLDGVVASAKETKFIREFCGEEFLIVTPAIRPTDAKTDDQKRTGTARQAILDGSTFLVVGRPVYDQPDPVAALQTLNVEVEQALAEKEKGAVAK